MHVISFYNAKGGVGKTTSACAVAAALSVFHNFKVCCIDLDLTQNSLSRILLDNHLEHARSILDVLFGEIPFREAVQRSTVLQKVKDLRDPESYQLAVCPCLSYPDESSLHIDRFPYGEKSLLQALAGVEDYDFLIIDCPPAMNALTKMALVASDGVLVPLRNDLFSFEGLTKMLAESASIKQRVNQDLTFLGVFFTQDKENTRLSIQMKQVFADKLKDNYIPIAIPDSVIVSESTYERIPANLYKPWSLIDLKYRALTGEIMHRLGVETKSKTKLRKPLSGGKKKTTATS